MSEIRVRLGAAMRDARRNRGWSQAVLAASAGVSQPLVSAIESAEVGASIESFASLAAALDADLSIELRPPRVIGRIDQRDPAHARCVAACRRVFEHAGLACAVEREIVDGRMHGWIDLLGYAKEPRRLVLAEIKTEIRDVGGLERQVGWYARMCVRTAHDLGWQPKETVVVVALLATAVNDAVVIANRRAIGQAFPMRGTALASAIVGAGRWPDGVSRWSTRFDAASGQSLDSAWTAGGPKRRTVTTQTSCVSSIAVGDRGARRRSGPPNRPASIARLASIAWQPAPAGHRHCPAAVRAAGWRRLPARLPGWRGDPSAGPISIRPADGSQAPEHDTAGQTRVSPVV